MSNPARGERRLAGLESLRGFAAFYLLLHHISSSYLNLKQTIFGQPFRFGQEGVLVFFLLSGFVICYSTALAKGRKDFPAYLLKRGRRIYPIFLLSLVLAYGIACWNARAAVPMNLRILAGNLFMLQDHPERPGAIVPPFADNMPLWSLSFEWWFYMMFYPIYKYLPAARQKFFVMLLCVVALGINALRPNGICWFLIFFPIWWTGVEFAREFVETGDVTLKRQAPLLGFLLVPAAYYAIVTWNWRLAGRTVYFIEYPFVEFRYFFLTIVFVLGVFLWKQWRFALFNNVFGIFRVVAPVSYALYLFHYPLVCGLRLLGGGSLFYLDLALRVCLAFLLAWLAEGPLQRWINSRTDRFLRANGAGT